MSRKFIASLAVLVTLMLLASCAESGKKTVGIAKFVAHPALDAVEQGIVDEIKAAKPMSNWTFRIPTQTWRPRLK